MRKVVWFVVLVALAGVFAWTLYYLFAKSQEAPVVYSTAQPSVQTIVKKTVATGSVVPRKEVEIKPQVSGIVEKLFVEPGDVVKENDLIARIRIIPNMLALNNAENRLNQAEISLQNAQVELDRDRRLRDEGVISKAEWDQTKLDFEQAKEERASAQDNLDLIRRGTTARTEKASNTLVRATIAGMVLEVPLEEGDSVIETNTFNDGTTIATVADMDELIFVGKIDESDVGKIRPGMELLLTIGALETERFTADLEHIAPKGVEENGAIQFEIRAALDLQEGVFVRANYSASADIVLDKRDDVLAIDEGLVTFEGEKAWVEVETAPQQFERREIRTGLSDGIYVEVVSGLAADEAVKKGVVEQDAG